MATKSFKGRPLLGGNLDGEALASKQPSIRPVPTLRTCLAAIPPLLPVPIPTTRSFTKKN